MSQPNFDLGINDLACFQMSDISSSGDERIIKIDMDEIVINSKELELPVKTEEQKEAEQIKHKIKNVSSKLLLMKEIELSSM